MLESIITLIFIIIILFIYISEYYFKNRLKSLQINSRLKLPRNYRLIIQGNDMFLYKGNSIEEKINKFKGVTIKSYLIGEKNYYITNMLTRKVSIYELDKLPINLLKKFTF